jgi:hypothetical protein
MTIYEALRAKLGREPTHPEIREEVRRILAEAHIEAAERGKLPHQRRRAAVAS